MAPPTSSYLQAAQALGFSSAFFISGIHFSASHLALPLLLPLPKAESTTAFASLFYRGKQALAPLAAISSLTSAALAYLLPAQRLPYAVAAVSTFSTLPFTAFVMMGVIDRLLLLSESSVEREKATDAEVEGLLGTWKWMNHVRAGFAAVGGAVGAYTTLVLAR